MYPLFKNPEYEESFEKDGYILLPGLNPSDISQLREFYYSLVVKDDKKTGIYVGIDMKNKGLVSKMVEQFSEIILPKVQEYLNDPQLMLASFVVKNFDPMCAVLPHQDFSIVEDESKHYSVSCWIPLQDVNINNGCLGLIKGSNRFFENIRPAPGPKAETSLTNHMSTIFPYLELMEMKAGELLIFDSKCIHASPPNLIDKPRIAIIMLFTQKEAETVHYYLKPGTNNKVLRYKITPKFFQTYSNALLSELYDKGLRIEGYGEPEEMQYDFEKLSTEEMIRKVQDAGNIYNVDLAKRMKEFPFYNSSLTELVSENSLDSSFSFWKIYSYTNILQEIKNRLTHNLLKFMKMINKNE